MKDTLQLFMVGVVGAALLTAAFLPGRQTVSGIKAIGSASSGVLGTAIKG